jgi:ribosome-binding factor A
MNPRRLAKISHAIHQVVASAIVSELRDPRVKNVTVLGVAVAEDLRSAKVKVSVMGDEKTERLCLHGLRSAAGYLQSRIADRIESRYTPVLSFQVDRGVKRSIETSRLLRMEIGETAAGSDEEPIGTAADLESTTDPEGGEEPGPDTGPHGSDDPVASASQESAHAAGVSDQSQQPSGADDRSATRAP